MSGSAATSAVPATSGAPAAAAAAARRAAAAILRQSRFHLGRLPRPFHGVLHAVGVALQKAGHVLSAPVRALGRLVPGGVPVAWVLVSLVVVAVVAEFLRRRARAALTGESAAGGAGDPRAGMRGADLEREATRAEQEGRFTEALRLRFRAGLARLSEQGLITRPGSTPSAQLARTLGSPDFDTVRRRFDEVTYGGAAAGATDVQDARDRWARILRTAPRRARSEAGG